MDFINIRNCNIMILIGVLYAYTVHTGTGILFPIPSPKCTKIGGFECEKLSEEKNEKQRFLSIIITNIIMLIALFLFTPFSLIQSGLLIGFLFSTVYAYWHYWRRFSEIAQFFSLLAALVILVFGTYRMLIQKKKSN